MSQFYIHVQANVDNTYGANVYAFAMSDPGTGVSHETIIQFAKDHLASLQQMNVQGQPTTLHVPHDRSGSIVVMEANLENMFTNFASADTHYIPYAYSEYSVYVVAHNELDLYSQHNDNRRYNEYTVIEDFDIIVSVESYTKQTITSNIADPTGNLYHHYTVAFVDANTTKDMASWYLDQRILNETVTLVFNERTISSDSPEVETDISNIVGNLNDLDSYFSMDSVNNSKIFVITRDMGNAESPLTGINYYGAEIEERKTLASTTFPRIERLVEVNDGSALLANVTAYNSVENLGVPTRIRLLAIERNANIATSGESTFELANVYGTAYDIPVEEQRLLNVYSLSTQLTQAMTNVEDFSFSSSIDPSMYEYELHMILYTETGDAAETRLLTTEQRPTHGTITKSLTPRSAPLVTINTTGAAANSYNITTYSHEYVSNTESYIIASTDPNLTTANLENLLSGNVFTFTDTELGNEVSFSNAFDHTSLQNKIYTDAVATTSPENVNRFYLYAYIRVDDTTNTGYLLQKYQKMNSRLTNNSDNFFAYITDRTIHSDHLTANIVSVYNNSGTSLVGNVYAFVADGGVPNGLDYNNLVEGTFERWYLDVGPYQVHTLSQTLRFDTMYDYAGNVITLQPGRSYLLHVVYAPNGTKERSSYAGYLVYNAVPGVLNSSPNDLTAAFVTESGNIEITNSRAYITEDNSNVHYVAYTYDVFAANNNDFTAFENQIYNSPSDAVLTVPLSVTTTDNPKNEVVSGKFLDFVVDSNLDVENAFATNNAYVYAWVSGPSGNVSSVAPLPSRVVHLTAADRFYPYIAEQPNDAYDGTTFTVTNASVVESNVIADIPQKVDKYYVFAFDKSLVNIDAVTDAQLLSTFGSAVEAQSGVLGHFNDVEPNIDTYDIHVAESVNFTHVFTSSSDPTSFAKVPIERTIEIVLLAVNSPSDTAKSFRRDFVVPNTVPGVRELSVSFVDLNANIAMNGGFAYGNVDAGDQIHAIAYTYVPTLVETTHASVVHTTLTTNPYDFSINSIQLTEAIDSNGAVVPVSTVNQVYVFAWVNNSAIDSANASYPDSDLASEDKVFSQLRFTKETNTQMLFEGSLFNGNVDSNVDRAYVALFEASAVFGKTEQEIANFVVAANQADAVVHELDTTPFPIPYGEVLRFDNVTPDKAYISTDPDTFGPLRVGVNYHAYLVTKNNTAGTHTTQARVLNRTKNYFGVVEPITHLSKIGSDIIVQANVSGTFDSSNVVAYASLFTYPESNVENYEPHKQVIGVTDGIYTVLNKTFTTLVDIAQESENAYGAGNVHAYVWVSNLDAPTTHNVTVTTVTVDGLNKYAFSPAVDQFVPGDTYNFTYPTGHPLYFSTSATDDDTLSVSGTPDDSGTLTFTVPIGAPYTRLYAHCNVHSDMGSVVNGVNGIPVEYRTVANSLVVSSELTERNGSYPRINAADIGYRNKSTDIGYYDRLFINPGALSLFDNSANVEQYYAAAFVSLPADIVNFMLGNVTPVTQFVEKYDLFYNDTAIPLDYAYTSNGTPVAIRSDTAHHIYVLSSSTGGVHTLSNMVTVNANNSFPIVTSFQGVLDFPEGNIDIQSSGLELRSGNVGAPVNFYMSAFTFDVMEFVNGNITQFNDTVRYPGFGRFVTTSSTPDEIINSGGFANITASIVDTDIDQVPVATANVAYMYMWADIAGTLSAVTPSTLQVTSISPYPRIRETTVDDGNISVTSASVFTPTSNIDKYYLFTVKSGSGIDDTTVGTFATTLVPSSVSGLLEYNDFSPDLIEGDVFIIAPTPKVFNQAYANVSDATETENLIAGSEEAGVGYTVYLVVVEAETSIIHFHKTDTLYTTGTYVPPTPDVLQPNITYMNLDSSVVNDYSLTATFEALEPNLSYYAVIHAYPNSGLFNADYATGLMTSLTPVFTASQAQVTDPYYTNFTLTSAVDTQGNVVDIHTVVPAYLYAWAYDPVSDQISLIEEQTGNIAVGFGTPPPSEPVVPPGPIVDEREFGVYARTSMNVTLRTYEPNTTVYKRSSAGAETVFGDYTTAYTKISVGTLGSNEAVYTKNNQVVGIDNTNLQGATVNIFKTHVRGKYFINKTRYNSDTVYVLAHHDNTTITYDTNASGGGGINTVTKNKYDVFSFTSTNQWSIVSDNDISVSFFYIPYSYDHMIAYPAGREIFGFLQGTPQLYLLNTSNMNDTSSYTVKYQYTNSATIQSATITNGTSFSLSTSNYETAAVRAWLEGDVPDGIVLSGSHTGDGDGADGSSFIPREYLSRRFVIPSTTGTTESICRVLVSFKSDGTADAGYTWYQAQTVSDTGVLGSTSIINPTYTTNGMFASLNMGTVNYTNRLITCSEDTLMIQHYGDDEEVFIGDMYRYFNPITA